MGRGKVFSRMESGTAVREARGAEAPPPEHQNFYEAFKASAARLGDDVAIRTSGDDVAISWNDLLGRVNAIAGGLASLGLQKGDTVALMLNNRPEFFPCDLGVVALGAVPFSIYQTYAPEQIAYVTGDASAKIAFVETAFLENFEEARKDLPDLEHVIVVDGEGGTQSLEELEAAGAGFDPADAASEVGLEDLLTLI